MSSGKRAARSWKQHAPTPSEEAKHLWQTGASAGAQLEAMRPKNSGFVYFMGLLILCLGGLGALLFVLLHSPNKTPIITVVPTNYSWPLSPSAWRLEDLQGLKTLSGQCLQLEDASTSWHTRALAIKEIRKSSQKLGGYAKRKGAILLYLSMHTMVNEEGEPCVVPQNADPLDPSEWIGLDEIVALAREQIPDEVNLLIVLDCLTDDNQWQLGITHSTFLERVASWLQEAKPLNVSVLASSDSGQSAYAGPDIRSSIFGREFRLGIAGAADLHADQGGVGDGDGVVSLFELAQFLQQRVQRWTLLHRGSEQAPQLLQSSKRNFPVSWAMARSSIASMQTKADAVSFTEFSLPLESLQEVSSSLDQLRDQQLYRYDPIGWAELERNGIELERMARSGNAYKNFVEKQLYPALQRRLSEVKQKSTSAIGIEKYTIIDPKHRSSGFLQYLPSLTMKEYLGEISTKDANQIRSKIAATAGSDLGSSLVSDVGSLGLPPATAFCDESNFKGLAEKSNYLRSWSGTDTLAALSLARDRLEKKVYSGDIRTKRLDQPFLDELDVRRRAAEDAFWAGPLAMREPHIDRFVSAMQPSQEDSATLAMEQVMAIRDRMYYELLPIGKWLFESRYFDAANNKKGDLRNALNASVDVASLMNGSSESPISQSRKQSITRYEETCKLLRDLDALLVPLPSDAPATQAWQVSKMAEDIVRAEKHFLELIDAEIESLSNEEIDTKDRIPRIEKALEITFLTSSQRHALLKALQSHYASTAKRNASQSNTNPSLAQTGSSSSAENPASAALASSEASKVMEQLRQLWRVHPWDLAMPWKESPLIQSVDSAEATKESDRKRFELHQRAICRLYAATSMIDPQSMDRWIDRFQPESTDSASMYYARTIQLDKVERLLAYGCSRRPSASGVLYLRDHCLKRFLIWQLSRSLEDFYANGTESPLLATKNTPFFAMAAQSLYRAASSLSLAENAYGSELTVLKARTDATQLLASDGLTLNVKRQALGGPNQLGEITVEVVHYPKTARGKIPVRADFPEGTAYLVSKAGNQELSTRRTLAMTGDADPTEVNLPLEEKATNVALRFRGHEFDVSFMQQGSVEVVQELIPPRTTSIALLGDRKVQTSTMLILDCSWSMGGQIPVEAISTQTQSKLDIAKENVVRILYQLAAVPDARVGVRLFGHRVGWSRPHVGLKSPNSNKTQLLFQTNYVSKIPEDLIPSQDVETILPLGRFGPNMVDRISKQLESVSPWGQSPLYFALQEAFGDFHSDQEMTSKSIIVITDGDNFQFATSSRPGGDAVNPTTLEDVRRAWNKARVPIFILGVGVDEQESPNARNNLKEIANLSGGVYFDIANGEELVRALAEHLDLGQYSVQLANRSSTSDRSASWIQKSPINRSIDLPQNSPLRQFLLRFRDLEAAFEIEGGEALEMQLAPNGSAILPVPFERNSPKSGWLKKDEDTERIQARVHRTQWQGNDVRFSVSLQNADAPYTKRPREIWIEVRPIGSDPANSFTENYVCYQPCFAPDAPVPLIEFIARSWPKNATRAEVQVWTRYDLSPPKWSMPIAEWSHHPERFTDGISPPELGSIRLFLKGLDHAGESGDYVLQVSELHESKSASDPLRLELAGTSLRPKKIVRKSAIGGRSVVHSFYFDRQVGEQLLQSNEAKLIVTPKSVATLGAWHLRDSLPIQVTLTSDSILVPTSK